MQVEDRMDRQNIVGCIVRANERGKWKVRRGGREKHKTNQKRRQMRDSWWRNSAKTRKRLLVHIARWKSIKDHKKERFPVSGFNRSINRLIDFRLQTQFSNSPFWTGKYAKKPKWRQNKRRAICRHGIPTEKWGDSGAVIGIQNPFAACAGPSPVIHLIRDSGWTSSVDKQRFFDRKTVALTEPWENEKVLLRPIHRNPFSSFCIKILPIQLNRRRMCSYFWLIDRSIDWFCIFDCVHCTVNSPLRCQLQLHQLIKESKHGQTAIWACETDVCVCVQERIVGWFYHWLFVWTKKEVKAYLEILLEYPIFSAQNGHVWHTLCVLSVFYDIRDKEEKKNSVETKKKSCYRLANVLCLWCQTNVNRFSWFRLRQKHVKGKGTSPVYEIVTVALTFPQLSKFSHCSPLTCPSSSTLAISLTSSRPIYHSLPIRLLTGPGNVKLI